jgi:hypothetical protein
MRHVCVVVVVCLALAFTHAACKRESGDDAAGGASKNPAASAAKGAVLTARPNPVPAGTGSGPGSTTLTWGTDDKSFNQVYVSVNEGPDKLVAQGGPGSQEVPWIHPGPKYKFRLYAGKEHQAVLATVDVTKEPGAAAPATRAAAPTTQE